MATINDIAKYAGISIATVSRALNKPELVNAETRERVMYAARKLNYFKNETLKILNVKSNKLSIGVIFPYITAYYFSELYSGISKAAKLHDIDLVLYELRSENMSKEGLEDALSFARRHLVDGIMLAGYVPSVYDEIFESLDIPVVLLLGTHESAKMSAYKVDDIRAAFDAISFLVSRGHRNIGMISLPLTDPANDIVSRFMGYKQGLDFYKLPFSEEMVAYGKLGFDDGYSAMKQLLAAREKTGITAVFTAADEVAIGAMRCIQDAGLRVPQDISVIGFGNLSIANISSPKLTTVAQPFEDIGAEGVKYMTKLLTEPGSVVERGNFYLPYKIIERESVAAIMNRSFSYCDGKV
ncbi:LacI family DNA-binding transcriptional regulator [Paenibacillus beijingensis]|uniref:HTH lacI-type domain-containing protein n=1 Tax=Paenibacillus beijingensis TaxID=1126833 RepID=A0A0D5NGA2_9BACL|nr:LacI family DNA-binding transcriptional regulator [Paenibacillus beijingensis]AJY73948.1 hypothetical protein VN24_04130 [Paenibacillus beijingensis]